MVNVFKSNFIEQSNDLIHHLPKASFIALDEEMTGISIPTNNNGRPPRDVCPSQQFQERLKQVPERYSIIQLGISLFEKKNHSLATATTSETVTATTETNTPPSPSIASSVPTGRGYPVSTPTTSVNISSSTTTAGRGYPEIVLGATNNTMFPEKEWTVRRYNFYMFPDGSNNNNSVREIVLNPGAVAFLQSHNMSFDTWCSQGIPYIYSTGGCGDNANDADLDDTSNTKSCPKTKLLPIGLEAIRCIEEYTTKTKKEHDDYKSQEEGGGTKPPPEPSVENTVKRTIELTRIEDIAFFARVMAGIREWLDNPITTTNDGTAGNSTPQQEQQPANGVNVPNNNNMSDLETVATGNRTATNNNATAGTGSTTTPVTTSSSSTSFLLPSCNSYLRRALYESIHKEYPTLIAENGGNGQIRLLRLSQEEKYARYLNSMKEKWNRFITNRIGMWRIYAAISLMARGYTLPTNTPLFAASYEAIQWDHATATNNISSLYTSMLKEPYDGILFNNTNYPNNDVDVDVDEDRMIVPRPDRLPMPIIVHNGFMDLLFLMTHFCCNILPTNFCHVKKLLSNHFPIIYDTKILATECLSAGAANNNNNDAIITNTSLSGLYQSIVRDENVINCIITNPTTATPPSTATPTTTALPLENSHNDGSDGTTPSSNIVVHTGRLLDLIEVVSTGTNNGIIPSSYGRGGRPTDQPQQQVSTPQQAQQQQTQVEDQEHEAAYDAYMTGAVFIGLCQRIWYDSYIARTAMNKNGTNDLLHLVTSDRHSFMDVILSNATNHEKLKFVPRQVCGRNKLYQMSMFTLDLELENNSDPLSKGMDKESTYRVSGFDPSLTTHDIVRSISGLYDSDGRYVNFEIIWIDDTTFLAAAVYRNTRSYNNSSANNASRGNTSPLLLTTPIDISYEDDMKGLLVEHGNIIRKALELRFNKNLESIISLEEYLNSMDNGKVYDENHQQHHSNHKAQAGRCGWIQRALSFFGMGPATGKRSIDDDTHNTDDSGIRQPETKRRRV